MQRAGDSELLRALFSDGASRRIFGRAFVVNLFIPSITFVSIFTVLTVSGIVSVSLFDTRVVFRSARETRGDRGRHQEREGVRGWQDGCWQDSHRGQACWHSFVFNLSFGPYYYTYFH